MNKKITIRDIAKHAGVSPATVSGVLNNSGRQTPATVKKVLQIMNEIGYVPRRNKLRAENTRLRGKIKELAFFHGPESKTKVQAIIEGITTTLDFKNIKLRTVEVDNALPDKQSLQGIRGGLIYGDLINSNIESRYKFPCLSLSMHSYHMAQIGFNYAECGVRAAEIAINANSQKALIIRSEAQKELQENKIASLTFRDALDSNDVIYQEELITNIDSKTLQTYDFVFYSGDSSSVDDLCKLASKHEHLRVALTSYDSPSFDNKPKAQIQTLMTCPKLLGSTSIKLLLQKISDKMDIPGRMLIEPPITTI